MFLAADDVAEGTRLVTDICIVGGGAAGISVALGLAGSGRDVLLLEAGGLAGTVDSQAPYAGDVVDPRLHPPLHRYRRRQFGGSTTVWGGRCVPFDAMDFAPRDYLPHSGWPLDRADLEPWYREASRLCEAGPFAYDVASAFPVPPAELVRGFAGRHYRTDSLERFSCPTDFGQRYRGRLAAATNIKVMLNASVCELRTGPDGRQVVALEVADSRGRRFRVAAREVVLAAGGLEVPRLLLASRTPAGHALGNAHDLVGRFYMCHLAGTVGEARFAGPRDRVHHGYDVSPEGVYCRRRFALTPAAQAAEGIGNVVARLHHPRITNPDHGNAALSLLYLAAPVIPWEYRQRLVDDEPVGAGRWLAHAGNVVTGAFAAAGFGWHLLRDRLLAERKFPSIIIRPRRNVFSIDFHAEQEPNAESRVGLGESRDAFGVPRLRVDWRYTRGDVRTVSRALALLAEDFAASDGRLDYDPAGVEAEMIRYGAYGGHHIGTARMSRDPRHGVVDADGRVHDVHNLHIAGSAVFPTSSQANPTLTIVAMALRLAAQLRQRTPPELPHDGPGFTFPGGPP